MSPSWKGGSQVISFVVSVGPCKIRLTEMSMDQILQLIIGDNALSLKVLLLDDRVFLFLVASKLVGLHV
jgi:hypothetical protein